MKYLKLMRVKHYVKNAFVFIPLIFSMSFFNVDLVLKAMMAFLCFSLVASLVYIMNDIVDIEKDRMHPKKKLRPLASGEIKVSQAIVLLGILSLIILACLFFFLNGKTAIILGLYLVMNIAYSFKLKNVVLVDVLILSLGFIFRVYAGAYAIGVEVSEWLLLTTFAISMFLGFGKRYGEKRRNKSESRAVLNEYSEEGLRFFMIIMMTLTIVFYSLYTIIGNSVLSHGVLTVPVVVLGIFRYFMILEGNGEDGDPTEIVLSDRIIQGIVLIYGILLFVLIMN